MDEGQHVPDAGPPLEPLDVASAPPSELVRAELTKFLDADGSRLGQVYRLRRENLDPDAIARRLGVSTSRFAWNYERIAKALLDGDLPTAPTVARQAVGAFRSILGSPQLSRVARTYLGTNLKELERRANAQARQVEEIQQDRDEVQRGEALRNPADESKDFDGPEALADMSEPSISAAVALPGLQILARWATCIGNATTLGAALELAASRTPPDDVAEAIDALRQTPLQLGPGVRSRIAAGYDCLWKACGDERHREIFRQRIAFHPPTLDELGAKMMLTRERVRQLQKRAQQNVSAALLRPECAEIRWRAAQLRQELGTAISWNNFATREALDRASRGIDQDRTTAETLLLWVAGPYRLDKRIGWLFAEKKYLRGEVGPRSEIGPPPRPSLLQAVSEEGAINIEAARAYATAAGLVPAAVEDWIAFCPIRDVDGKLVLWHGNVADKAAALLGVLRRPATADELNGMIAEGHSARGLRVRILGDERFIRTDRFRVGLRQWGLEEYSGIVDEIEEEIARRGGKADVDDLVRTLSKQFALRSGSVVSYTAVPRFVVHGGCIHVRQPDEPFVPSRTLFDEARVFLLDEDRCCYRVRVDDDVLRGSGRPLPQGVGAWLGLLPGMRREFRFRDEDRLLVSWPDSALLGPTLGSLRRQALARSARPGDSLLLEFDRSCDEVETMLVTQSELETATGWVRGILLTGIDAGNQQEFDQLLAKAVGASSTAALRRKCRDRGDLDLIELVHSESSPDLDEALERLKEVL